MSFLVGPIIEILGRRSACIEKSKNERCVEMGSIGSTQNGLHQCGFIIMQENKMMYYFMSCLLPLTLHYK